MSGLRIFETDPGSMPKPRFQDDIVGRFRSGRLVGKRPQALATWRVTTGDPTVAGAVAQLMGGTAEEWETSGEDSTEVITDAERVKVVIDGPDAIRASMVLWGRQGPIHECDGRFFLSLEEDKGKACGCPELLADRKAAARAERGPSPNIRVAFRLADDVELGKFRFVSSSWELVKVLHEIEDALERVGGPALCELGLEAVEFVTKTGQAVSYRKPVIKVIKAFNDAIADDPYADDAPF
ncbi:hypothetical protein ACIQU6_07485 [Streptomyces sp. NPDC090442]|uniref:recombination directionality factor n=1 Tax=Streptomyces sp. NPDC090442 TaxID=3365962 RepID=UPI00380FE2C9